eukprot:TRINITY_DN4626_c0_g3_i1.p1 TRINITY_DN4626_c0_g3~~TRINITY_DN4626_c0_g3_i1.p1  ORF type:complete len:301 (-),score=58.94 TRINITY_DN4626_c0_g3_i1:26-865(-)
MEKLLNQRSLLLQKKEDSMKKIREIGIVPSSHAQEYASYPLRDLMQELHKTNAALKKFGHVNKKALGQYKQFSEQKEELQKRWNEIVEGKKSIKQLIKALNSKKNDAIMRTFKGVAKRFVEVFAQLAKHKNGKASLALFKRPREPGEKGVKGVDVYSGVGFSVSFDDVECRREQLSAGQECSVALALIFAIHKCDPTPFYIFDEIDPNLDPENRQALAAMIKLHADKYRTQFISVTHHKEFCNSAHKHYLVTYSNRVSSVSVVDKDEAIAYVESLPEAK